MTSGEFLLDKEEGEIYIPCPKYNDKKCHA
jgi:hypothetical protein